MKPAALVLGALLLLPLPLAAQSSETGESGEATPAQVLESFGKLLHRGEARSNFGLPKAAFWRRSGDLALALFAEEAASLRPLLERAAEPFAEVSGLDISIVESGQLPDLPQLAELAPDADLVIVAGPRERMAAIAAAAGFDKGMLARFELGTWPFVFRFDDDQLRRGVVLLANDEPEQAREAAFVLAIVWGLGGYTLGPELSGLVAHTEAGPQLTPRGEAVFRLFFHEELEVGMPLGDAIQRAETLLPR